jgi:hypothetical protein
MTSRSAITINTQPSLTEPHQRHQADVAIHASGLWQSLQRLWCQHHNTSITSKTDTMPAHIVCDSCGWREPVMATMPRGTRTWDSSRDEARYEREKRRRLAIEQQKQIAMAQMAVPGSVAVRRRHRRGNIVEISRSMAG